MALHIRVLTEEEAETIQKWSQSRTEEARLVERAKIIRLANEGQGVAQIAEALGINEKTVRKWLKRFNEQSLAGLADAPRSGAPTRYSPEVKAQIIATALTNPQDLQQPFGSWTYQRLNIYLREVCGFKMKQTRMFEILQAEGLRWRKQETWFGERVDPDFAQKRGTIERLRLESPAHSAILDIDEMGPIAAKSYPGQKAIKVTQRPAQRATQEIDYGRRGKGYVFGALWETQGDCWTQCYPGRTIPNFIDFLCYVDEQVPVEIERIYAILDNLNVHHCDDLLLFMLSHPRWEMVYQPTYAAYLNLIEPWWKVLRSLALKGRRFETWQQIEEAIEEATAYWNAHKHPFVWGRKRRHRAPRRLHTVGLPKAA
jgi:transposase